MSHLTQICDVRRAHCLCFVLHLIPRTLLSLANSSAAVGSAPVLGSLVIVRVCPVLSGVNKNPARN
jgi:hypothetical protein